MGRSEGRDRSAARPGEATSLNPPPDDNSRPPRSRALIGLVLMAVLVVVAVYLVHALREESQREDCLLAGRTNCAPIEVPSDSR
jgi:hypothetical protein